MKDSTILTAGLIGSVLAALCCFTPVLVLLLGALGLTAWVGGLDALLLPILIAFLGIAAYGLWRRRSAASCAIEKQAHNQRD